jgi:hypothetical protein
MDQSAKSSTATNESARKAVTDATDNPVADASTGKPSGSESSSDPRLGSHDSKTQGSPAADVRKEINLEPSGLKSRDDVEASDNALDETAKELLSELRAEVVNVYVSDNRRMGGLYAGGNISARDIAGHNQRSKPGVEGKDDRRTVSVVIIAREELARLKRVTVDVGLHKRAKSILDRERFVVLHGPPGVGKGTAALSLLGFDAEVHSIDPSITVRELSDFKHCFPVAAQKRYVVESLYPATAERINRFVVRAITRALSDEQTFLVLTVDDRVPISTDISAYVVPWRERPEPYRALRSHLAYYLTQDDVATVEERFDLEHLEAGLSDRAIHAVDDVARAVAKAFSEGHPLESVMVETGFGIDERVEAWFREKRTLDEVAFLVAAAVLGGCSYTTVSRHASRLEEFIAQRGRIDLSKKALRVTRPRSERLKNSMAIIEPGFVNTEFGRSPSETVRLENRWLVQAVLERVWRQYDLVADALLDWLFESGADRDPGVRIRAASAVGWLSQFDFATVRSRLLVPWALGTTMQARAVADALGTAVWFDTAAPLVLALLNHWGSMRENYDLWWTAAAAYGGDVGVRYTSVAMDQLRGIVGRGDHHAPTIISFSASDLVQSGGRFLPDVATQVFGHLAQWLDDDPVLAFTAEMTYTELLRRASDPEIPGSEEYCRRLVATESLDSSGSLMRHTLGEKSFRADALASIEKLVRFVDLDTDMRDPLEALLLRSATDSETTIDAQRLVHYLDRWATAKDPSAAAAAILRRLQEVTSNEHIQSL